MYAIILRTGEKYEKRFEKINGNVKRRFEALLPMAFSSLLILFSNYGKLLITNRFFELLNLYVLHYDL